MKQIGLFGETKEVEAKNEKLAQEVLPAEAFAAIYAAVAARRESLRCEREDARPDHRHDSPVR